MPSQGPARPAIVVCVDFSRCGRGVLEAGARLARDVDADMVLLHVLPRHVAAPVYEGPDVQRLFQQAAEAGDGEEVQETTRWAEQARSWGVEVRPVVVPGPPASAIVEVATQEGAAMVVVGRLGKTGLRRLVLGSVADEVVRRSPCPVLVVPEPADAGRAA